MKRIVYSMLCLILLAGCSGAQEAQDGEKRERRQRPTRVVDPNTPSLELADTRDAFHTIQLYRTGNEVVLPIIPMGQDQTLTLAFDMLEDHGRPFSVYFYHAKRTWERDLSPAEYLTAFQRDDLLDYQPSRATEVPYYHYHYTFPNDNIDFRLSGNYILRVTEQGREDEVVFERPFFVSEQAAPLDFQLDNVMITGQGYPSVQPIIQFTPPSNLQTNIFNYSACFVRNGRFGQARCNDQPRLIVQPAMLFDLDPYASFSPETADYFVDISTLQVGNRIEYVDYTTSPFEVTLEPDYARFAGTGFDPLLNGQPVVSAVVNDLFDPELTAQYVHVRFRYVPPDEQPLAGDVLITGSFNQWKADPRLKMTWHPEFGRYEGVVRMKQGQYEYRYITTDNRINRALATATPRLENLYTAFVYYNDITMQTDRLLTVTGILAR